MNISIHPPREGWDGDYGYKAAVKAGISIHPPREGWDTLPGSFYHSMIISIHPPREGWDTNAILSILAIPRFQSTHPVRGGTGASRAIYRQ